MIVYLKKKKKNIFRYVQISQPIMTLITYSPHTHTHTYITMYYYCFFLKKKNLWDYVLLLNTKYIPLTTYEKYCISIFFFKFILNIDV